MASFFKIPELPGVKIPWYGRLSLEDWRPLKQHIYQRDGGLRQYCHTQVAYEKSHCHHVLPLSEGGVNHPSNLKTACHGCHEDKHPFMNPLRASS